MPKVSVLMPVYKTPEDYLREAISSILQQSFTDFELVILDDCPSDRREKVVSSFNDPRIRYLQNEHNLGISRARNKLIDLAEGEYLAVFDHDDVSMPNRLELQARFLDEHPEYGLVGCQGYMMVSKRPYDLPVDNLSIRLTLIERCCILHSGCMLRKAVLRDNGIRYEEDFSPAEDYALFCRLMRHTKFYNLPDRLLHYRDFEGNTTSLQMDKVMRARNFIIAFARTENPDLCLEQARVQTYETKFKLFGKLTVVSIITCRELTKVYLFKVIPLLAIRRRIIKRSLT